MLKKKKTTETRKGKCRLATHTQDRYDHHISASKWKKKMNELDISNNRKKVEKLLHHHSDRNNLKHRMYHRFWVIYYCCRWSEWGGRKEGCPQSSFEFRIRFWPSKKENISEITMIISRNHQIESDFPAHTNSTKRMITCSSTLIQTQKKNKIKVI